MSRTLDDRGQANLARAAAAIAKDVIVTPYQPGRGLPLFIQPNTRSLFDDTDYAIAWLDEKRPVIEEMLWSAGAIVLRGFPIDRSIHFSRLMKGYGSFTNGYMGGVAEREVIVDNVMTANSLRSDLTIDMHQEMSYLPNYPNRIAFYCRMPPVSGGATLLCDMREVTGRIDPELFREVAKRGIRHTRNYRPPGSTSVHPVIGKYHKIWSEAFETDDPAKAETTCRAMGFEVKWFADGSLETAYRVPGIVTHPHTEQQIWFNQVANYMHTPRSNPELYQLHEEAYAGGKRRPFVSSFGDGCEIPVEMIEPVKPLMSELAVAFSWGHGDVLLIDNYLVAHGRAPYAGRRDIQVALLG